MRITIKMTINRHKAEVVIACAILVVFVVWASSRRKIAEQIHSEVVARHGPAPTPKIPKVVSPVTPTVAAPTAAVVPVATIMAFEERSLDAKEKFLAEAKIQIRLPPDLRFEKFDFDNGMPMLASVNKNAKMGFAVFAAKGVYAPADAIAFFKTEMFNSIPSTKGKVLVDLVERRVLPAVPTSGLGEIYMWRGRLSDRNDLHVALVRRQDGKGTYMLIVTGSEGMFSENEGLFERMYLEMKAIPI